MNLTHTPTRSHRRTRDAARFNRLFAIIIIFSMGASVAVPAPAAAQSWSLSGTVADSDGNPLAGVEVVLKKQVNGSLWSYHETTTDKEGAYAFAGMEQGTWTLEARLDGYRSNETSIAIGVGDDTDHDLTLVSLTERVYSGTILDSENETSVGGALIRVTGYGGEDINERTTTSAADGTFSIRLFAQENRITIEKGGYGTWHDWVYQPNGVIERTIYLHSVPPQSAVVQGSVVDANGDPVQAYINLRTDWSKERASARTTTDMAIAEPMPPRDDRYYGNHNSTTTDQNGTFTMRAYPGDVVLEANRRGYLVQTERVTLEDGQTTQVTFTLLKLPERTVTLNGRVTDKDSGAPVSGASVSIQVPDAGDHHWTSTDEDGRFTATVRPGYTLVEVSYWSHHGPIHHAVDVAENSESSDSGGGADSENTSKAGSAPANDEPKPEPKRYHPRSFFFVTKANETRDVAVALTEKPEPQTNVVGYVIDVASGQAVAGAQVSLQNHDTGEWGQATTDQNGSYKFTAYGGYHTVRVWAEGYLPFSTNLVLPGSGGQRVDFDIHPGEHAQEGWWSPDGEKHHDGAPRPMPVDDTRALSEASADGDAMYAGSPSAPGMSSAMDGPRSYEGTGGGLPAYDAQRKTDTFGAGETEEAPTSALMLVLLIGALAVAVGLRRDH